MSRSYRHVPIMGTTGNNPAQKKFKQQEHRRERAIVTTLMNSGKYDEIPHTKKYGNEWASPRDGKTWFGRCKYTWPEDYPKWMRK